MAEIKQYLDIMLESLGKKKELLQKILDENKKQAEAIENDCGMDEFNRMVTMKNRLLQNMISLDNGFQQVYERVKEEMTANKEIYKDEILRMLALIAEITDLNVSIQASEQRNKQLAEAFFIREKRKVGQVKKNVNVAKGYYQTMHGINEYTRHSRIDKKK